jgi:acetylornithine/succinyldiaminopimelate/putrescine aminotransferase
VLDVIEDEELMKNATAMSERLRTGLAQTLGEVGLDTSPRGRGLLVGVPVAPAATASSVILALLRRGFLTTEAGGNVVRCTPPLTVDAESVDAFVHAFAESVRETQS